MSSITALELNDMDVSPVANLIDAPGAQSVVDLWTFREMPRSETRKLDLVVRPSSESGLEVCRIDDEGYIAEQIMETSVFRINRMNGDDHGR